jgi:hypothetical protein
MSPTELLTLLFAIVVLWIVLKVAKFTIKVIFLVITIVAVAGVVWYFFVR